MQNVHQKLYCDLEALGLSRGDSVLVHTSLKSLHGITACELADTLLALLGDEGTLLVPAFSYFTCNKDNPNFSVSHTPSNVGYFPEFFRLHKQPLRSICPTHSCTAKGRNAEYLTSGHYLDQTPCGKNSPFARLRDVNGKILFIGCGTGPNTSMHAVEELYEPPYLFGENPIIPEYTVTLADGSQMKMKCKAHDFRHVKQRYDRLTPLLSSSGVTKGIVSGAECFLYDANKMWKTAGIYYQREPMYFVDKVED